MRKYILYILGIVVLFALLLTACGGSEQPALDGQTNTSSIESSKPPVEHQKPTESSRPKEAKRILDRDIFIFKKDGPELYTAAINDMDKTIAYVDNWNFGEILNDANFENIDWTVSLGENNSYIVAFSGEYKYNKTTCYIQFYVSDGIEPIALSLYTYSEKDQSSSELSVQRYLDENKSADYEFALLCVDASISCMLTVMSEEAVVPASEYYEAQADQYMNNGNYDRAIECYEKAHTTGDKISAAYYAKAESCLAFGDFDSAGAYFKQAGNYKDSQFRVFEVFYKAGEQHEKGKDYISAIFSYSMAGDYSNAREKYRECNYKQGMLYMTNKQYLDASKHFVLAETYSDASTMASECYYCYGKKQFEQNYISEAIEYFSKCRGYKDTDELLLSYYYEEAIVAFDNFLDAFVTGKNYEIGQWYDRAAKYLVLCEGYKDSINLLNATDKLYYAKKYLGSLSSNQYGVFTLKGMSASVNGSVITLDVPSWTTDAGVVCSMVLNYDMGSNTFDATLKNMYFDESVVSKKNAKMIESLLFLFTDLDKMGDFVLMYSDVNKWNATWKNDSPGYVKSGSMAQFLTSYGGYAISVDVKLENGRLRWIISAKR